MAVAKTSLGVSALKGFCEAMRSAGCRLGSLAYGSSTCLLVLPPSCSGSQNLISLGRKQEGLAPSAEPWDKRKAVTATQHEHRATG